MPYLSSTLNKALTTLNKRNLHGYTRFLPHHLPATLRVHHHLPSQFPLLPPFNPPSLSSCLSLRITTPWDLGQREISPSPELSSATVAEAAAQGYVVEVFVSCRKIYPCNPAYPFLFRKSFQALFSYSRHFPLQSVEG